MPNMIETNDHLYFSVSNKLENIYSFYDKNAGKIISFKSIDYDDDCIFYPSMSRMSSYGNYFVSSIPVDYLKGIKSERDNSPN